MSKIVTVRIYTRVIRSTVNYGCEARKMYATEKETLEIWERKAPREIQGGKKKKVTGDEEQRMN